MRLRFAPILTLACCGVGLLVWAGSPAAVASGPQQEAGQKPKPDKKYAYIGSKACKRCHIKVHKSWAKTKMAKAFETLKPDQAVEGKKKYDLDPEKDYTKDESCLKCHVTGFGGKDGYAIPDPTDKKAVKKARYVEGVGCEACHGPGEEYSKVFKEIQKSKRKYKVEELYAVGLKKMDASACTNCHNDKSPTYDKDKTFDFEKDKKKDAHEHEELKQREG